MEEFKMEQVKDKDAIIKVKVGDRIRHLNYGEGTIVSIEWDYPGFCRVDFDTVGHCIVKISNISKIKENKEMTSYKVGDIVDHPLYNESIIIDISEFETGYISILPLTGYRRGQTILVSIDNVKQADNKLIISIDDYNKMANTIENLKKENAEMREKLYLASDKVKCAEAKLAINTINTIIFGNKNLPEIKEVLYHKPATIIFWKDGTKTVVKAQNKEKYDKEKGFVMAYLKKILGNKGNYYEEIKRWTK